MTYDEYLSEIERSLDCPTDLERLTIIRNAHLALLDSLKRVFWPKRDRKLILETQRCLTNTELALFDALEKLESTKH